MAQHFFVSMWGRGVNATGTIHQPFGTLQECADRMQPGDTCFVRGGVRPPHTAARRGLMPQYVSLHTAHLPNQR